MDDLHVVLPDPRKEWPVIQRALSQTISNEVDLAEAMLKYQQLFESSGIKEHFTLGYMEGLRKAIQVCIRLSYEL